MCQSDVCKIRSAPAGLGVLGVCFWARDCLLGADGFLFGAEGVLLDVKGALSDAKLSENKSSALATLSSTKAASSNNKDGWTDDWAGADFLGLSVRLGLGLGVLLSGGGVFGMAGEIL